jgi:hypothetical protein
MADRTFKSFKDFPIELRPKAQRPLARNGLASARESAQIQQFVEQLSRWMDAAFEVPGLGWRFGWDALIGLVPGVGDAATTLVALYIVALAGKVGLPRVTVARMGLNVAIDMLFGSLPLVGDLFDVYYKANLRNAALLRERLADTSPTARRAKASDWVFVGFVLASLVALFALIITMMALSVAALWRLATG